MSAYCPEEWNWYRLWSNATRANEKQQAAEYKRKHDAHISTCPICRAQYEADSKRAWLAVMPEFKESEE